MINADLVKDNLVDFKDNLLKSKKYWIICILLIFISFFALMETENYAHPEIEIGILITLCILSVFCITYYQGHGDDKDFYKTVFIVILLFGIVFSILTPIMCTHDETEHFVRAEMLSNGVINPEFHDTPFVLDGIKYDGYYLTIQSVFNLTHEGKIKWFIESPIVNGSYLNNNYSEIDKASDYIRMEPENASIIKTDADTQPINTTPVKFHSAFGQNPFYGYIAPAIGIAIAKLLSLNAIWMLWLGRIFNITLYAGLVAYAVKKTPILKVPLFVVACIPATMSQAASISIDCFINGLAILLIAYFLQMYKAPEHSIDFKEIMKFSGILLILTLCKMTFMPLIFLLLFIPGDRYKERKYYYYIILISLVLVGISGLWMKFIANPATENSWRPTIYYSLNHIGASSQIQYMLYFKKKALISILNLFNYLNVDLEFQTYFETEFNSMLLIFLGSIFFLYPHEKINSKTKIGALLVFFIIYFGTSILLMLTWAPYGSLSKAGIQSRYFFPIYALLPLFLGINHFEGDISDINKYIVMLTIAFMAFRIMTMGVLAY